MENAKQKVAQFLEKYGMNPESVALEAGVKTFVGEMEAGLTSKSTLEMLATYVSPDGDVPVNEPVIVIDAGGTNFRVATVWFDADKAPVVEDFKVFAMPGTQGELEKDEFFKTMASYLLPLAHRSNKIGFCFSYSVEMQPNKDGRLIRFSKEVKVKDMPGQLIGENLLKALKDAGVEGEKSIVILNDTVATLLGGKAAFPERRFDSYLGFILGTGTNTCYAESNAAIAKAPTLKDKPGTTLINMESGGYGKVPQGFIDKAFDATTQDPGKYTFEKMISGAYQGGLLKHMILQAVADGLFSANFGAAFSKVATLTSREIDMFCYYPYATANVLAGCIGGGESESEKKDRNILFHLIDAQFERAARLVAVNLAATVLKTGKGTDPCLPVCITAEGTTFYKSKLFRAKLDHYVKTFMNETLGIYCDFVQADKATLVGTAIAGLIG